MAGAPDPGWRPFSGPVLPDPTAPDTCPACGWPAPECICAAEQAALFQAGHYSAPRAHDFDTWEAR